MTSDRIVVWGASGFARKVADILTSTGRYDIVGFIDDTAPERKGETFCGKKVLGGRDVLAEVRADGTPNLAFGFGNCHARMRLFREALAMGFALPAVTHASAVVAEDAVLGAGCLVAAGTVLEPNCKLGDCVFINTGSSIGHDDVISEGTHICPGVTVAGCTTIGRLCWVGVGSTVINHIQIGSGTFVGAGSLVVKDLPEGVVAFGSPARVLRKSDGKF